MSFSRVKLSINLRRLSENVQDMRNNTECEIISMIKANAYGHGINEIHHFLHQNCGVNEFGLASIEEAIELRKTSKNYSSKLIVFSDISFSRNNSFQDYVNFKVIPVISSLEDLEYFLENNKSCNIPLFIKINTGMNRLGISYDNLSALKNRLVSNGINQIDHLLTHFSSSNLEAKKGSKMFEQYEKFKKVKDELFSAGISIIHSSVANSGAIEQGIGFDETHVRPGIILYGASVLDKKIRNKAIIKPRLISSMETSVIDSFDVTKNTEVGYGDLKVDQDGKIVVVGVGYGDGLPTRFSGATVKSGSIQGKVFGKINMDLTSILFPPNSTFIKGSRIEIWGENSSSLTDISDEVGVIPYEILCNIGQRVNKEYVIN